MHLIVWGGNHFSLWRVLEHLASTVFRGPWPAYSSQTRSFFSEEEFASETVIQQRAPIGPAFFALSVDEAALGVQTELFCIWTMLPSETPRRGFKTIWWYDWRGSEQLAWRSMGANMSYATRQCVQYFLSR